MKKDLKWSCDGVEYIIQNVPYLNCDYEELLDINISVKLTALRDLMVSGEIERKEIDFEDFEGIEF